MKKNNSPPWPADPEGYGPESPRSTAQRDSYASSYDNTHENPLALDVNAAIPEDNAAAPSPNRRYKEFWRYLPLLSIVCMFWWIVGLALWVHYTQLAYSRCLDTIDILQITVSAGVSTQINRVLDALVATCVVFTILAICMHALGLWKAVLDVEYDMTGKLDAFQNWGSMWGNIGVQVAWWIIIVWMVVMLLGFGAFSAFIYSVKSALTSVVGLQRRLVGGRSPTVYPGFCPISCLNTFASGVFTFAWSGRAPATSSICLCDYDMLSSAEAAMTDANSAIPGMLVGVVFMVIYGVILLTYLSALLVRTSTEVFLANRLVTTTVVFPVKSGKSKGKGGAWQVAHTSSLPRTSRPSSQPRYSRSSSQPRYERSSSQPRSSRLSSQPRGPPYVEAPKQMPAGKARGRSQYAS